MNPSDGKKQEPMSEQTYPNRVRVQPLLPLPNATIPGKNRKKRRVVKIAIGDEIPLELNHSLDGVTTPPPVAKPSRIESNHANNNAEARIMTEIQHDDIRHEVTQKHVHPTVNNNHAPSPLSPLLSDTTSVVSVISPKAESSPTKPPLISSKADSSLANPPPLVKIHKGVSFPPEHRNQPNNDLPSNDQSTEMDQTTAVTRQDGFLEREYTPAQLAKMDKALGAFQRGQGIHRHSAEKENKSLSPFSDKKRPSIASMNTRQSSAGKQISTMRLKEGYHHYRKPATEVVEIGDEEYASMVPFIYDAAYPQSERDLDGNKLSSNIQSFFSSVNKGFTGVNRDGNNKAPSERSGKSRSATTKCLGRLCDVLTCRSAGNAMFGSGQDEAEKRDEMIAKAQTDEHDDELNYPLFYWVKNRDISQVKRVLKEFKRATPVYVSVDGTSDGKEECIHADKAEMLKRDAAGATVLHIAYLFEEFEIARYLVEQYPSEALLPYDGDCKLFDSDTGKIRMEVEKKDMLYSGENILHIAIIKRNIPETRWLLEFYRDKEHAIPYGLIRLLTANAVGTFFRPIPKEESFYFGGFPLLFAVSCGDKTMFDLVLAYASSIHHGEMEEAQEEVMFSKRIGADYDYRDEIVYEGKKKAKYVANGERKNRWNDCSDYTKWELKVAQYARKFLGRNVIFLRDIYGNNALHLCVLHKLQPMFVHVKGKAKRLLEIEIRDAYTTFLQYARTNLISPKRYEGKHIFILPTLAEDCFGYSPDESFLTMPIQSQYESGRWMESVVAKKLEERFMMVLNEDLHSPLTLAAAMPDSRDPDNDTPSETAKKRMLNFLLNELHSLRWEYGPVRRELVDLAGVEMQFDKQKYPRLKSMLEMGSKTPTMKGAITWLCETKTDDCIMIEEVVRLIESKWHRCGYEIFRNAGIAHLFMTLMLTVIVCLVNATPHYSADPSKEVHLSRNSFHSQIASAPMNQSSNATISNNLLGNTRFSFPDIDQAVSVLYPIIVAQMIVMFFRDVWASIIYYVVDGNILYRSEEYTKYKKSHPFNEPEHDHVRGASGWKRTWSEWLLEWITFFFLLPFTIIDFFSADARGAAWFNLMSRYLITLSFGIHCIFKYIVSREGDPDIYFGDDDTIRQFWHDDSLGHSGAMHLFYRPVNDMRVLLPLVVCIIVAWIRSFFFLMGFDATGPFVLTINKIITGDVPFFFGFFFIIVLALACGICMLINGGDPSAYVGFYYLLKSFWVLLKLTFNNNIQGTSTDFGLDVSNVPNQDYVLFDILYTLFFFMVMIMINLLIAIMSNTYDKFKKDSQSLLMMEKYNIMTYFEGAMLSKTEYREKYTIHKSDVKMPQGWKEYTGEKDVLDRWDAIRQMVAARRLKELQYYNNTSDHDNNRGKQKQRSSTLLSITTTVKASAEVVSSKPMMFKMDKGGKVTYDPAPSHLFHDAERSNGTSTDQLNSNHKNTHRSPFSVLKNVSMGRSTFLKDPKDRPHLAYEFQKVGKDWFASNDLAKQDNDTKPKVVLLIIDPQVDFHCNAMNHHPDNPDELGFSISTKTVDKSTKFRGSLAVTGADEDSQRIAKMITENLATIDEIYVTMDTHHKLHMAHAISWTRGYYKVNTTERTVKTNGDPYKKGEHPENFTEITHHDVVDGVWVPGPHLDAAWCQEYTKKLEVGGKFKLTIWPEHCLIGTPGHAVVPVISEALTKWSKHHRKSVNYIRVGQNIRTEVYSVFKAEVEDPTEAKDPTLPGSTFNHNLMSKLKIADKLLVCGQALSHCVNFTFRDLVAHFDDMKKLYLLRDGCSCVYGCDDVGKQFIYDMEKLGVHVVNTDVVFRLILRKHVVTSNTESSGHSSATNAASQNNMNLAISSPTTRRNSLETGPRPGPIPSSYDSTMKLYDEMAILKKETEELQRNMLIVMMKNSQKEADPTTVSSDNNSVDEVSARYESRISFLEKELKEAREQLLKQQSH